MRGIALTLVAAGVVFLATSGDARPATATRPATASGLTADFTCSPPSCSVAVSTKVTFSATSNATDATFSWDLNDDNQFGDATGPAASTSFPKAGTYSIHLQATDPSTKDTVEVTRKVTVDTPPAADLQVVTAAPTSGSPVTLSAAASTPGTGQIVSYDWDFNGDGHFDSSTGTNPTAHFTFTTGMHTVGLRVATATGLRATTTIAIDVLSPVARGHAGCNSELDLGRVKLLADCISPAAGGSGYTLTSSQLTLNGLTLVTRSGNSETYTLTTNASGDFLTGPALNVVMQNTPLGDIVVGSYDPSVTPVDLTAAAAASGSAGHGASRLPRVGYDPPPNLGIRLFTFAVGHSCADSDHSPACCPPPSPTTACATLPGGFPLAGSVSIYLDARFQVVVDLNVALDLPSVGFSATGELQMVVDLATGVHLESLQFAVPHANLRYFEVRNAQFQYFWPDYADPITGDTSQADSWTAQATVAFGPTHAPALSGNIGFHHGAFDHAGVTLTIPGGVPLYPGVLLNRLGGQVYSSPFAFGGTVGASIATVLELTLNFTYQEANATTLGYLGGQATLDYQPPGDDPSTIASLTGEVFSDGFFDAALNIDIHFPLSGDANTAPVRLYGNLSFWDESSTGRFEGTGDVHLKLFQWIDLEVAGLYNNQYVAGCAAADGFGVQGYYDYHAHHGDGGLFAFSNCTDQLRPYHTHPVTAHCGPFTPGGCINAPRMDPLEAVGQTTKANQVTLPPGLPGEEIRVTSSGTPIIKVTSPDGHVQFTTPSQPGQRVAKEGSYIAAIGPNTHQVLIFLKNPVAGTWKLAPTSASDRITKIESADDVRPPVIRVRVSAGHGRTRVLTYRIGNFVAGSKLRFVERGRDTTHVIGTATQASGTLSFQPEQGMSRHRRIEADLSSARGVPQSVKVVGRYTAPPPVRGGKPTHLRFKRKGGNAVLTWHRAANARFYLVVVKGSDKRVTQFLVKARSPRRVTILRTLPFETFTATVRAEGGPDGLAGPAAKAKLGKAKSKQRTLIRSASRLRHLPGELVP